MKCGPAATKSSTVLLSNTCIIPMNLRYNLNVTTYFSICSLISTSTKWYSQIESGSSRIAVSSFEFSNFDYELSTVVKLVEVVEVMIEIV